MKIHTDGDIGVIKTGNEFVIVVKDKIFGPWKNESVGMVVDTLEKISAFKEKINVKN